MFTSGALLVGLAGLIVACDLPDHIQKEVFTKTAITNVHVFDGTRFGSTTTTVVLAGGIVSNANPKGATTVDGMGGYLIPGLIDSHCHIMSCSDLTAMRQHGVTTALDMGTFPYSAISSCRAKGVTDVRGSGAAATVHGTAISVIPGFPENSLVTNAASGKRFVLDRVAEGVDYIKIFLDPKGPDEATVAAIVQAAHAANKLVITHATTYAAYGEAERGGADIRTHTPLDKPLDEPLTSCLTAEGRYVIPTLIMMQSIVNNTGAPLSVYNHAARGSVTALRDAGVPILVGTDANTSPHVPANPPFGQSIHDELALLVAAGLSPVSALQGATSLAASRFGLFDRGAIVTGMRADLVLLAADPTVDIANTRSIKKVWVAGVTTDT